MAGDTKVAFNPNSAAGLDLSEKIDAIKEAFDKAVKVKGEDDIDNYSVLQRKEIKQIVLNVSLLKEHLTIDAL